MADIRTRRLLGHGDSLLLAVSGGQDSLCLARIMLDLSRAHGWRLAVAHCDHRWRPDSADNAEHVRASDRAETLIHNVVRGAGGGGMAALQWRRRMASCGVSDSCSSSSSSTSSSVSGSSSGRGASRSSEIGDCSGVNDSGSGSARSSSSSTGSISGAWDSSSSTGSSGSGGSSDSTRSGGFTIFSSGIGSSSIFSSGGGSSSGSSASSSSGVGDSSSSGAGRLGEGSGGADRRLGGRGGGGLGEGSGADGAPGGYDATGSASSRGRGSSGSSRSSGSSGSAATSAATAASSNARSARSTGSGAAPSASDELWLVRPLLAVSRDQTRAFCAAAALPVWVDSTNEVVGFARRNRIRLQLLPYLRAHFNPRADEALARTAEVLHDETLLLEQLARGVVRTARRRACVASECKSSDVDGAVRACAETLAAAPLALRRRALRQLFHLLGAAPAHADVEQVLQLLTAPPLPAQQQRTSRRSPSDGERGGGAGTHDSDPTATPPAERGSRETGGQWRIENMSKVVDELDEIDDEEPSFGSTPLVVSDCFEGGIPTWWLSTAALMNPAAGWLTDDTLVVKVDVTVRREDRFQLDTGGVPCDMALKLSCGAEIPVLRHLLPPASPFFRGALEDVTASAPIPVDGSLSLWTYILSCLYPLHDQPKLTLSSVYMLLPVVHKYDFPMLLTRLVAFAKRAFVKQQTLSPASSPNRPWQLQTQCTAPVSSPSIVQWLTLAVRLQLDELRDWCLARIRAMPRHDLVCATTVEQGAKRVMREDFKQLEAALLSEVFTILASK
ncbi:hypothetical protein FOA52_011016 [Chlamydomonas sp. UWO 241]|nr:hypothetical protein FOA52_011016 [Chlamydomonas sp. UWO 241]